MNSTIETPPDIKEIFPILRVLSDISLCNYIHAYTMQNIDGINEFLELDIDGNFNGYGYTQIYSIIREEIMGRFMLRAKLKKRQDIEEYIDINQ